jgi:outer membrane immunogenic protein
MAARDMRMTISRRSTTKASIAAMALIGGGMATSLTGAQAADLAVRRYTKAPAIAPAMAYDWGGFYVGANGGWGSSRHCWDALAPNGTSFADGCHNATGAVAGGQIGYRWQSSAWVFGVEAQGDWANLRGSGISALSSVNNPQIINGSRVDRFGLFTGQIGYAVNAALLYVKGGAAVTSNRYTAIHDINPSLTAAASDTRWGGTVGVGLEYGFASNWSAGIEYDHLFMSDQTNRFTTVIVPTPASLERISQNVDLVTLRLNYRVGGR